MAVKTEREKEREKNISTDSPFKAFGGLGLIWSNVWKNSPVKQNPKVSISTLPPNQQCQSTAGKPASQSVIANQTGVPVPIRAGSCGLTNDS